MAVDEGDIEGLPDGAGAAQSGGACRARHVRVSPLLQVCKDETEVAAGGGEAVGVAGAAARLLVEAGLQHPADTSVFRRALRTAEGPVGPHRMAAAPAHLSPGDRHLERYAGWNREHAAAPTSGVALRRAAADEK
ncbi:hypothetical protein [Streptomyces sp. NPDC047009]|uniref:hypothetical protein n=1 Tax=unclassified Streptomyces TaxID=2593676 RepID=UPI0033F53E77